MQYNAHIHSFIIIQHKNRLCKAGNSSQISVTQINTTVLQTALRLNSTGHCVLISATGRVLSMSLYLSANIMAILSHTNRWSGLALAISICKSSLCLSIDSSSSPSDWLLIFVFISIITSMARNILLCADVPLRNYSLTLSFWIFRLPVFKASFYFLHSRRAPGRTGVFISIMFILWQYYEQTMCSGNIVLNTIYSLYHNDIRKICSSYNVTYHSSIAHIKQTMWYHFMRLIPN